MAWSAARPLTRLSDARSSYVIELAKYSAMLTSPTQTHSTMMSTDAFSRRSSGCKLGLGNFISTSAGRGQDRVRARLRVNRHNQFNRLRVHAAARHLNVHADGERQIGVSRGRAG